jgi:hypothetical protein
MVSDDRSLNPRGARDLCGTRHATLVDDDLVMNRVADYQGARNFGEKREASDAGKNYNRAGIGNDHVWSGRLTSVAGSLSSSSMLIRTAGTSQRPHQIEKLPARKPQNRRGLCLRKPIEAQQIDYERLADVPQHFRVVPTNPTTTARCTRT